MIKYWDTFFQGAISISEWCRVESVPTPRFQQTLYWFEASAKKISTISSFPLPEPPPPPTHLCWLPYAAIWTASWLRPRPTTAACGLGWLTAVPADMCSSKMWMNNGEVQPGGFFFPLPEQCVYGDAPVAYSTGKLSKEVPHRSQKHWCSIKI